MGEVINLDDRRPRITVDNPMWKALFPVIDALGHKAQTPGYPKPETVA